MMAWRDLGCPHRRRAFEYVHEWHSLLAWTIGATVTAADCPDPFTKARALNLAITGLPPATVVVQVDPDSVLAAPGMYADALTQANRGPGLVVPHDRYLYLTREATEEVVHDWWEYGEVGPRDCEDTGANGVGNVTVYSRETWAAAGGYDERFPLWAGDDAAFAIACGALVAPQRRLPGDVVHLWHPRHPDSLVASGGYAEQLAILNEYTAANEEGPDAVRALVASR